MAITNLERRAKESRKRQAKVLALLLEESKALLAVTPKGEPFVSTSTCRNVKKQQLEPVASVGAMSALKQIALNLTPSVWRMQMRCQGQLTDRRSPFWRVSLPRMSLCWSYFVVQLA
jgi:hypothetical protein